MGNEIDKTDDKGSKDPEPTVEELAKEKEGLMGTITGLREKNRGLSDQLTTLNTTVASMQNQINQMNQQQGDQDDDDLDSMGDDDLMTAGEARSMVTKMVAKELGQHKQVQESDKQAERNQRMLESERNAISAFTAEKCGAGLDWQTVMDEGFKPLVQQNPKLFEAMQAAPDPARFAYEQGLLHSDIKKRAQDRERAQIVDELHKKGVASASSSDLSMQNKAIASEGEMAQLLKVGQTQGESALLDLIAEKEGE